MKCPFCGAEMEKGWVQATRMIVWDKKKKGVFSFGIPSDEGFELASNLWSFAEIEAFNCPACKKVIIDYSENETVKNK